MTLIFHKKTKLTLIYQTLNLNFSPFFRHNMYIRIACLLLGAMLLTTGQSLADDDSEGSWEIKDSIAKSMDSLGQRSNLLYLLAKAAEKIPRDEILVAPPGSMASRLHAAGLNYGEVQKRADSYWIWMPARGYVSVPRTQVGVASNGAEQGSHVLRYG